MNTLDEYDRYAEVVLRTAEEYRDAKQIETTLSILETEMIGLRRSPREWRQQAAQRILDMLECFDEWQRLREQSDEED